MPFIVKKLIQFTKALTLISLVAGPAQSEAPTVTRGIQDPIPDELWDKMQGVSWHVNLACPAREDLRLLTLPYLDFDGDLKVGQLVVAADVAEDLLDIFSEITQAGFQIEQLRPVSEFDGDDRLSMMSNNTSAFNCRVVAGSGRMSQHAFGHAIDINPVQNPFVTRKVTSPDAGTAFDDPSERSPSKVGIITAGDAVTRAFKARGWGWGGDWTSLKDYQHFSKSGN